MKFSQRLIIALVVSGIVANLLVEPLFRNEYPYASLANGLGFCIIFLLIQFTPVQACLRDTTPVISTLLAYAIFYGIAALAPQNYLFRTLAAFLVLVTLMQPNVFWKLLNEFDNSGNF